MIIQKRKSKLPYVDNCISEYNKVVDSVHSLEKFIADCTNGSIETDEEIREKITPDGVKYHINKLRKAGIIERVGADKGGYWKVNE